MATIVHGTGGTGGFPPGWRSQQTGLAKENITKNSAVAAIPFLDWGGAMVDYLDLPNAPTGAVYGLSCATGEYIAVRYNDTPYLKVYRRSGQSITELSISAALTGGTAAICFSSDGTYLAVSGDSAPFVIIYKRSGNTFTKLSSPTIQPTESAISMSFAQSANYLAIGSLFGKDVKVYKRSGDTFTLITNAITLPDNKEVYSVAFSPDGLYLAIGVRYSLHIYKRSGDTFTLITNVTGEPTGTPQCVGFSPDGVYLAVGEPYAGIEIFKRSGDSFAKLSGVIPALSSSVFTVQFSPDGAYIAAGHSTSPFLTLYKRDGDTFTALDTPQITNARVDAVSFSTVGDCLYVGFNTAPYLVACIFKSYEIHNAGAYIKPGAWSQTAKLGIALENAQTDANCKINLFPAVNTEVTN